MIKVYIRYIGDEKGELLGEFFPNDISQLPILFDHHTTLNRASQECTLLSSSFVIGNEGTYFEIVLEEME